jgi:hypothetical protein
MCAIQDISEEWSSQLSSHEVAEICRTKVFPLRVALAILDQFDRFLAVEETGATDGVGLKRLRVELPAEKLDGTSVKEETAMVDRGISEAIGKLQATKSDDAAVPEYLWNNVLVPSGDMAMIEKLSVLRKFALRWVKRRMTRGFLFWFFGRRSDFGDQVRNIRFGDYTRRASYLQEYLGSHKEARLDWEAGHECIARFANSTWWKWTEGSRPHFWRWPEECQRVIRDGVPPWFRVKVPRWQVPQRMEKDESKREVMKKKLEKVRRLGYIQPGQVDSLTSYFSVPKGDTDIRMVYDGTKSGLNDALWAPWFAHPTVESHLRSVGPSTHMGDIDIGDMFHNFVLHEQVQRVAGIDLTPFFLEELITRRDVRVLWERWVRCAMGLKCSPYNTIQGALIMDEFIRGNPKDPKNVLRWDYVRLNLPGSQDIQAHLPWISLVRKDDGCLACNFDTYVDDTRTCGNSREEAKLVSRAAASKMNWLGIQDAARKRRDPCQNPGPWAGSVVHVGAEGEITVLVTQERWNKTRSIIEWIRKGMDEGEDLEFKTLEKHRGFLVYVSRTYPSMVPYLRGIHLTLDSWRPWRKEDGWKMTQSEIALAMRDEEYETIGHDLVNIRKAPARVRWVPRLRGDIEALTVLTASDTPPHRSVRPKAGSSVVYSFGVASGS